MASCCDDHDICYDTCNKDKELCDLDFKRCLYSYCDKYEKSTVGGEIMVKGTVGTNNLPEGEMTTENPVPPFAISSYSPVIR
ncbi:hypothetical protein HA402_003223 [Bradysia odoriphaga]|nr:hypothetical protein HA402_003223 [Bradysia odoriphaga]